MATIAFTVIGSAIGGPVGGLIGSVIGQQIDNAIFRPKAREGPRIKELAVQTSSYGTQIRAVFGQMRVAGSVIWSTDLIEKRSRSSGGKGRASTISYSYSVSLAVALSSRPILRIGRIWAEGNLLRGAAGDFKVETGFRFHSGDADQAPDPLIASAEGLTNCPAYRGISYAVFENLQLAEFGNRIPSMTFELFERDGSVSLAEIFSVASDGVISGDLPDAVAGYALQGDSARAALSPLLEAGGAHIRPDGRALELFLAASEGAYAGDTRPVIAPANQSSSISTESRIASRRQPVAVALRYYDAQRDYQAGLQRSGWSTSGNIDEQLDLPAVLDTASARRIAGNFALQRDIRRDRKQFAIATSAERLVLGQSVGETAIRATEVEHFNGYSIVHCERYPLVSVSPSGSVEPGRHQPSPDLVVGTTLLHILEFPSTGSSPASAPIIGLAAGGTGSGWRRASVSRNIGGDLTELGTIAAPSAIGTLLNPIAGHPPNLIDNFSILQIRIDSNSSPTDRVASSPLASDAPVLMVGNELIRYGAIEPLGGNLFAVSGLLRDLGKTGSPAHLVGETVVFVDRDALLFPDFGPLVMGGNIVVEAEGLGDVSPVSQSATVAGLAVRPLAPVHGRALLLGGGSLAIDWIRRARHDPGWLDGTDLPNAEGEIKYTLLITRNGMNLFAAEVVEEALVITAAQVAAWAVPIGATVDISIRQSGMFGLSDALSLQTIL
jgi:hypothetical protein